MPTTALMIEALVGLRARPEGVPVEQFWMLVERFRADLVHQAFAILKRQQDAEDVAQETLCKAFLNLNQLHEPAKLGAWLRSINRREALAFLQRQAEAKERRLATGEMNAIEASAVDAPPEAEAVLRAVDSLPAPFRDVVILRYWEKLNTEEIAVRLGVPAGTVRSRLTRADGMLALRLKPAPIAATNSGAAQ